MPQPIARYARLGLPIVGMCLAVFLLAIEQAGAQNAGRRTRDQSAVAIPSDPAFTFQLPNQGPTLEVVALHDPISDAWWKPDGTPMAEGLYRLLSRHVQADPKKTTREIIVRIVHPPHTSGVGAAIHWSPRPFHRSSYSGNSEPRLDSKQFQAMSFTWDQPPQSLDVFFTIADQPYEYAYSITPGHGAAAIQNDDRFIMAAPPVKERNGEWVFTLLENISDDDDCRYDLLDDEGEVLADAVVGQRSRVYSGGLCMSQIGFQHPGKLKTPGLRLQSRPFRKQVHFKNIALNPGPHTEVKITGPVTLTPPPRKPVAP